MVNVDWPSSESVADNANRDKKLQFGTLRNFEESDPNEEFYQYDEYNSDQVKLSSPSNDDELPNIAVAEAELDVKKKLANDNKPETSTNVQKEQIVEEIDLQALSGLRIGGGDTKSKVTRTNNNNSSNRKQPQQPSKQATQRARKKM